LDTSTSAVEVNVQTTDPELPVSCTATRLFPDAV